MSTRTKVVLSLALFGPVALVVLTGFRPIAMLRHFAGRENGPWLQLGRGGLAFSIVADSLVWLTCVTACILIGRLAYRLRNRVPFGLTASILGLVVVCFGLQRLLGYGFWMQLGRLGPELAMVRATASVIVVMAAVVLYPHAREMIGALAIANREHEKFEVAAESSLDAFYILESVRDESKKIVDFRFTYMNANGENRFGRPRLRIDNGRQRGKQQRRGDRLYVLYAPNHARCSA